ncbi:MAG: hypothetical protein ACOY94_28190 [Bacillota bacterium]
MSHWDDTWLPADLCKDLDDDCGCPKRKRFDKDFRFVKDDEFKRDVDFRRDVDFKRDFDDDCGCDDRRKFRKDFDDDFRFKRDFDDDDDVKFKKRRKAIPVGEVTVDCTPVTFRTKGQAINIVSCPVSQVLNVPVTRQVNVQVPLGIGGCVLNVPLTERVQVPVVTTVNLPPVQTPVPTVVCPPFTVPTRFC